MEDTELHIEPEVYEEILRNTDKRYSLRLEDRILRKAMVQLVKSGHATFLFLADDESRAYWGKIVKAATAAVATRREAWCKYEVKQGAWDRLSIEDRKTLRLRHPIAPKFPKPKDE